MKSQDLWMLFIETGAPEVYMLYNRARRMEGKHVFNDPGTGAQSYGLQ